MSIGFDFCWQSYDFSPSHTLLYRYIFFPRGYKWEEYLNDSRKGTDIGGEKNGEMFGSVGILIYR